MNDLLAEREQDKADLVESHSHKADSPLVLEALRLFRSGSNHGIDNVLSEKLPGEIDPKPLLSAACFASFNGLWQGASSAIELDEAKYAVKNPRTNPDLFNHGSTAKKFSELVREASTLKVMCELKTDKLYPAQINLEAAFTEAREVIQTNRNALQKADTVVPGVSPDLAMKRHEFLTKNGLWRLGSGGRTADQYIGSLADVENSSKLFAEGTREANMIRGLEIARRVESQFQKDLAEVSARYSIKKSEILTLKSEIMKCSSKSVFLQGFKTGASVTGGCMLAGYFADKALGIESSSNSLPRAALDGFVIPTILLSNLSKPSKIVIAATTFGVSRSLGKPESSKQDANPDPTLWFTVTRYNEDPESTRELKTLKDKQLKVLGAR